jgi:hypothetical protein
MFFTSNLAPPQGHPEGREAVILKVRHRGNVRRTSDTGFHVKEFPQIFADFSADFSGNSSSIFLLRKSALKSAKICETFCDIVLMFQL